MILIYLIENNTIIQRQITPDEIMPEAVVWVDMYAPTIDEKKFIEQHFNIDVLTSEEISRIEVMTPFYRSREAYYMTFTTISKAFPDNLDGSAFTTVMTEKCLITLHYEKMPVIKTFISLTKNEISIYLSPEVLLSALIEVIIHDIGEILEKIDNELNNLIHTTFHRKKQINAPDYNSIISKIGYTGNTISRSRESLVSINRLIIYFINIGNNNITRKDHQLRLKNMTRENTSLTEYANFLSQRIGFLLDATLGLLSVEQNTIVKVFTVASTVMMPPTLVASIYGMNFRYMPPEVTWQYGYIFALSLMVVSSVVPFLFFKKKRWI